MYMRSKDQFMKRSLVSEARIFNPRITHHSIRFFAATNTPYFYYSRSTTTAVGSSLYYTKRMGRTQEPVLTQQSSSVHHPSSSHTNKWHSSLASASASSSSPLINGHTTPQFNKSTLPTPAQLPTERKNLMGNVLPDPKKPIFFRLLRTFLRIANNCVLDTTLSLELRNKLGIRGIMPPGVDSPDIQIERCLARIRAKQTNLDKYVLTK